jgi:HK97 family phage major capsid protein/HK97 family phage prohead protease
MTVTVSTEPWSSFPDSAFSDEQYAAACLIDRGGDGSAKQRCSLPVREPDGDLNRGAMGAAAAVLSNTGGAGNARGQRLANVSDAQIAAARRKLVSLYRSIGEDPPEGLLGASRSRPATGELEQRSVDGGAAQVDGRRLRGLIPYNVESRDLGGWTEVIDPGALTQTDLSNLIATREHDRAHLLGRYPTTLQVEDRSDGFAWSVDLPGSPVGEDVRVAVQRGDLRASSWRMIVGRDYWAGDVRHVADIAELHDVTVTAMPAYGDEARAEYRSLPQEAAMAVTAPETAEAVDTTETEDRTVEETEDQSAETEDRSTEERPPARRSTTGRLRIEDRSATPPARPVEARIIDAMRGVREGENRSLTDPTLSLIAPPELSTYFWDLLRPQSVVLESGIRVIVTDRQSVQFPHQTADPTATFYNELDPIIESDPTYDQLTITPKAIKALVRGSSEAFEDSSPDLLTLLEANLQKVLALNLDGALLFGSVAGNAKAFDGMDVVAGSSFAWTGVGWTSILKAVGHLAGAHVPPPYHVVMHPWAETALSLTPKFTGTIASNELLDVPAGVPPRSTTSLIPTAGTAPNFTSTAYVYAPNSVAFVRRRDVTIEVDRSMEFSSDSVLVRGKLRGAPCFPYPAAVCKVTAVPTPDPAS